MFFDSPYELFDVVLVDFKGMIIGGVAIEAQPFPKIGEAVASANVSGNVLALATYSPDSDVAERHEVGDQLIGCHVYPVQFRATASPQMSMLFGLGLESTNAPMPHFLQVVIATVGRCVRKRVIS